MCQISRFFSCSIHLCYRYSSKNILDQVCLLNACTACQNVHPTSPYCQKKERGWNFFWTTGDPWGVFRRDIKIFHRGTRKALFQKTDFLRHFLYVFIRCSHVPQSCPTKFEHKIALLLAYYLPKFQQKWSRVMDRSGGVTLIERVFWPFWAHFCTFLPQNSMQSNEIHTQDSHAMELLSPEISAQMVERGLRNRPRHEVGKNAFWANSGRYHNWLKMCLYLPHASACNTPPVVLPRPFWLKFCEIIAGYWGYLVCKFCWIAWSFVALRAKTCPKWPKNAFG